MDRNVEMFAACDEAFDHGRFIAIYPEGATRTEAHLQRLRTGAARIALGYEVHAPGRLTVIPAGRPRHRLRFGALPLTRAQGARRLLAERGELIEELDRARRDHVESSRARARAAHPAQPPEV